MQHHGNTNSYSPEQARAKYKERLRWSHVLELGERFGVSGSTMKKLMKGGAKAVIPRIVYPGTTQGYYDREVVLAAVTRSE